MGEIAINPIHNVHKKYRTMNFVNHYIFTPPVDLSVNTEIGGVAASINTPQLLATKLAIDVSRITNFSIVGSDIKCKITGSYGIPDNAFINNNSYSYYKDSDYLVTSLGFKCFENSGMGGMADFQNVTSVGVSALDNNALLTHILLKNAASISDSAFSNNKGFLGTLYIPNCLSLGSSSAVNNVFLNLIPAIKIYCHPSLATNNAGNADGDLDYAISKGAIVRYVSNFTAPNQITNLSIGTVYATALQLNFTPPTVSTNAIEFYECYANGIYKNTINGSGGYITGLTANASYSIEVRPVDVFYNKSSSNVVAQSTMATYYTDADANAFISAASLTSSEQESVYKLIVDLKTNSLWNKIQALYPFKGTTAAQHKWNAKNPIDANAAFRLTFTGVAAFSNLGYQLNGSSYADTNLIPSANQNVNSNGMTLVCGTNNPAFSSDTVEIGSFNTASQASLLTAKSNNTNFAKTSRMNGNQVNYLGINDSRGVVTVVKQTSTLTNLFFNGNKVATGNSGGSIPTLPIWIGCLNYIGAQYGNSSQRMQIAIIHEGLSDAEVTTLHSIIDLSESIAGRKTW